MAMNKLFDVEVHLKVRVLSDCPMRAADKVVKYLHRGPYEVLDWHFTESIYPEHQKG